MAEVINLGDALLNLKADTSQFDAPIDQATSKLGGLADVAAGVGDKVATGLKAGAAGLTALVAGTAGAAADFQSQVAIMSVAAEGAGLSLEQLRDAALAAGSDTQLVGITASEAADAITGLLKAGLGAGEIFGDLQGYLSGTAELSGALRAAIDLQAASELNLAEASDLAAIALASFGNHLESEAEKAQFINDAMNNFVKAADASVASVSGLADALVNVGPTAAGFGFSLEEVNTALALLSTRGIEGAEAGTALKSMLLNITRQTKPVKEAFTELGISLFDAEGNMKDMRTIIEELQGAMAGMTQEQQQAIATTLAGTHGIQAFNTLLSEGVEGWDAMSEAIDNAAGIQEQAAARTQGFNAAMEALGGVIETIQIRIGSAFLPILTDVINKFAEFLESVSGPVISALESMVGFFTSLPAPIQSTVGVLTALVGGSTALGTALGPLMSLVPGLGTALTALSGPIGVVVAATAGLATAFATDFGGIRTTTMEAVNAISTELQRLTEPFDGLVELVRGSITNIVNAFNEGGIQAAIQTIVTEAQTLWPQFVEAAGQSGTLLLESLQGLTEKIITWITNLSSNITTNWDSIWATIQTGADTALSVLGSAVQTGFETITGFITSGLENITNLVNTALESLGINWQVNWEALGPIVEGLMGALETIASTGVENIQTVFDTFISTLQGIWQTGISLLQGDWEGAWNAISETTSTILSGIGTLIENSLEAVQTIVSQIGETIGQSLGQHFETARTVVEEKLTAIGSIVEQTTSNLFAKLPEPLQGIAIQIGEHLDGIVSTTQEKLSSLSTTVSSAITDVRTAFETGGIDGVVETVKGQLAGLVDVDLSGFVEKVQSTLSDVRDALTAGDIQGAIDAVISQFQRLTDLDIQIDLGNFDASRIATDLLNSLTESINDVNWETVGEAIGTALVSAIGGIAALANAGIEIIKKIATSVSESSQPSEFSSAASALIDALGNAIKDITEGIGNVVSPLIEKLKEKLVAGMEDVGPATIIELVAQLGNAAGEKAGEVTSKLLNWLTEAISDINWETVGETIANGLIGAVAVLAGAAVTIATFLVTSIKEFFTSDNLHDSVAALLDALIAAAKGLATGFTNAGKEAMEPVVKGITDRLSASWEEIKNALVGALQSALDAAKESLPDFGSLGASIKDGILGGIGDLKESVGGKIGNGLKGAWNKAGQMIGRGSPARLFIPLGTSIMEGIAVGIDQGQAEVLEATAKAVNAISDAFSSLLKVGAGLSGKIVVPSQSALNQISNLADALIDQMIFISRKFRLAQNALDENLVKAINETSKVIEQASGALRALVENTVAMFGPVDQLMKRFPVIDPERAFKEIALLAEGLIGKLERLAKDLDLDLVPATLTVSELTLKGSEAFRALVENTVAMFEPVDELLSRFPVIDPEAAFRELALLMQGLVEKLQNVARVVGVQFLDEAEKVADVTSKGATAMLTLIESTVAMFEPVDEFLARFPTVDVDRAFLQIAQLMEGLIRRFVEIVQSLGESIQDLDAAGTVADVVNQISGQMGEIIGNLGSFMEDMPQLWTELVHMASRSGDTVESLIGRWVDRMVEIINVIAERLSGLRSEIDAERATVAQFVAGVLESMGKIIEGIREVAIGWPSLFEGEDAIFESVDDMWRRVNGERMLTNIVTFVNMMSVHFERLRSEVDTSGAEVAQHVAGVLGSLSEIIAGVRAVAVEWPALFEGENAIFEDVNDMWRRINGEGMLANIVALANMISVHLERLRPALDEERQRAVEAAGAAFGVLSDMLDLLNKAVEVDLSLNMEHLANRLTSAFAAIASAMDQTITQLETQSEGILERLAEASQALAPLGDGVASVVEAITSVFELGGVGLEEREMAGGFTRMVDTFQQNFMEGLERMRGAIDQVANAIIELSNNPALRQAMQAAGEIRGGLEDLAATISSLQETVQGLFEIGTTGGGEGEPSFARGLNAAISNIQNSLTRLSNLFSGQQIPRIDASWLRNAVDDMLRILNSADFEGPAFNAVDGIAVGIWNAIPAVDAAWSDLYNLTVDWVNSINNAMNDLEQPGSPLPTLQRFIEGIENAQRPAKEAMGELARAIMSGSQMINQALQSSIPQPQIGNAGSSQNKNITFNVTNNFQKDNPANVTSEMDRLAIKLKAMGV